MGTDNNISPKEMAFCVQYAMTGNGTKSAIEAGYPEPSAAMTASRLIKKEHIKAKVAEMQGVANDELVEGSAVTTANLIKELNEAIVECRKAKQFGPMVRCIELKGKTIAAFTDSIETFDRRTPEQRIEQTVAEFEGGPLAKILVKHFLAGFVADDETVFAIFVKYRAGEPVESGKVQAEAMERKHEQDRQKRATVPQSPATH